MNLSIEYRDLVKWVKGVGSELVRGIMRLGKFWVNEDVVTW